MCRPGAACFLLAKGAGGSVIGNYKNSSSSASVFLSVLLFPIFGAFLCHQCLYEGRERDEKGTRPGGGGNDAKGGKGHTIAVNFSQQ